MLVRVGILYQAEKVERVLDSLEKKFIYSGLKNLDYDIKISSRKKTKEWIREHPEHSESIFNKVTSHTKQELLDKIKHQDFMGSTEGGTENEDEDKLSLNTPKKLNEEALLEQYTLSDFYYFDSFFHYTDHSYFIFNISELNSIFQKIHNQVEDASRAGEALKSFCEDNNFSSFYIHALEPLPSPLIGDVDDDPKPRLIKIEDKDHIYAEFWSLGREINDFDVNIGDYKTIDTLDKAIVRIHLDTGHIEFTSDSGRVKRQKKILRNILANFNAQGSPSKSDIDEMFEKIEITDQQIRKVKEKLGVLSTLDEFRGSRANLRYTSVKKRNVESDPSHSNTEKARDYKKSHPRIVLGEKDDQWQFIYPNDILDHAEDEPEEEETLKEILNELDSEEDYNRVDQFTVTLNSDKDTLRIWKKRCTSGMRRLIFHLLRRELGW